GFNLDGSMPEDGFRRLIDDTKRLLTNRSRGRVERSQRFCNPPRGAAGAWDQGEVGFSSGFIAARSSVRNIWNRPCWKPWGGTMKESLLLLFLLAIGGGLNTAEAQPLPVRVGYSSLSASFSPVWMAKELDLFERQGLQSTPIY